MHSKRQIVGVQFYLFIYNSHSNEIDTHRKRSTEKVNVAAAAAVIVVVALATTAIVDIAAC